METEKGKEMTGLGKYAYIYKLLHMTIYKKYQFIKKISNSNAFYCNLDQLDSTCTCMGWAAGALHIGFIR